MNIEPRSRYFGSNSLQFDVTFWNLMGKCKAIPGEEGFVLSSYILGDGQGDLAHLQKEASILSKKNPGRKITVIAIAAEKHRGKIHPKKLDNVTYHIVYYGDSHTTSPPIQESPFADPDSILQEIKEASVWLAGPVKIKKIFDDLDKEMATKGFAIHEYGTKLDNTDNFYKTILLGLGDNEIGIYTHTPKSDYQWDKIENEVLKKALFNKSDITSLDVDQYLAAHAPFMCYVSSDDVALRFIYRALYFGYIQGGRANIDVIYPAKTNLSELIEGLKRIKNTFPIKSIMLNGEIIDTGEKGFNLRVINPGRLSKKDFKKVMYLSSPLVGCTGNASIGQALSYGKIPYYEQLGQTKQTKKNLCDIAYQVCGKDSPLVYLLDAEPRFMMIDQEEREKLGSDRLIEDAKKLGEFIKEKYSLNECLHGMVNSHLFRTKYPEAAAAIDEIKKRFLSHEIDIEAAKIEIIHELQKIGLLENQNVQDNDQFEQKHLTG